jgi:hypothetical protein
MSVKNKNLLFMIISPFVITLCFTSLYFDKWSLSSTIRAFIFIPYFFASLLLSCLAPIAVLFEMKSNKKCDQFNDSWTAIISNFKRAKNKGHLSLY